MKFFTAIFLLLSSISYAQNDSIPTGKYGVDFCVTDSQGKKQGKWVRVYESGTLYYAGQFVNGKPVGEFRYYYETGELMATNLHKEDGLVENTTFRKTKNRIKGTVISKGTYSNQKKHGEWLYYDEEGILRALETYKLDVLHGDFIIYYYNGTVSEQGVFEDGNREGIHSEYFHSGELKSQTTFKSGIENGEILAWNAPNVKLYKGQMNNGIAVGEWHFYLSDGRIEYRLLYDDSGVEIRRKYENGEQEEFYNSGIPKAFYEYKNGKKNGPFQEFYNRGDYVQREIMPSEQGEPIEIKQTLENTQVKIEGEYRMGNLHGEVLYFKENGMLEKTEVYEHGELLETILN